MHRACTVLLVVALGALSQVLGPLAEVAPFALLAVLSKAYPMLRNSASGPEIKLPGWISAGF